MPRCSAQCVCNWRFTFYESFNSLPNDKIWDQSNLKAFADDILNVVQMTISIADWIENIAGKGENAGYQHFLFFPQCFLKGDFS